MKKILLFTVVLLLSFLANAQAPILEFNFDGTFRNTKNDISFTGDAKFVNDRKGVVNGAIRVVNSTFEMTALNLPVGNSSRTVSIWVKYNDVTATNYIWGYGSSYNARYYGLLQQSTTTANSDINLAGYGANNDLIATTTIAPNIWYNYIVTYDGLISKIYRDGLLIKSVESPRKLTSGIVFSIGKMGKFVSINADIDDLQIYDVALSEVEITGLYNRNLGKVNDLVFTDSAIKKVAKKETTLVNNRAFVGTKVKKTVDNKTLQSANTDNSVKQKMVLSESVETTVIKSSEIYSTQGLKVFSGTKNNIDITEIKEGTYLLKIKKTDQGANENMITLK
ncbi:LamG domain-containing protein [Flavobacterium granuli]|uniref:Por secretion system C-terminal sorting domain-containing protein n=1 Tax=Flavobacterium granuli TaxID=280093 RepID=A0ABU1S2W8_9FLAO|nr:LamG domain-containing protein [Flavobacterium granuli]MDR6845373.1 hypothetical protein [Flavobacterium granuli]